MDKNTRKVTFIIDDEKYFKNLYKNQTTAEQLENLLAGVTAFKCTLMLYGTGNNLNRYKLIDDDGKSININSLNGYQHMCINECESYFEGVRAFNDGLNMPCGVVKIEEE